MKHKLLQIVLLFFLTLNSKGVIIDSYDAIVGTNTIILPHLKTYPRIDGKSEVFDRKINILFGDNIKSLGMYGTESDLAALLSNNIPDIKKSINILKNKNTENLNIADRYVKMYFDKVKEDFKRGEMDKSAKPIFENIERNSSVATSTVDLLPIVTKFGGTVLMGIYDETPVSLSHSIMTKVSPDSQNHDTDYIQVISNCVLFVKGKILTITVSSKYLSYVDLEWTREMALKTRNDLLEINNQKL